MTWRHITGAWVSGVPAGQPRARHGKGQVYNPPQADAWRETLGYALAWCKGKPTKPLEGVVYVDLEFYMPCPKGKRGGDYCTTKPDIDNLEKTVLDVMKEARWYKDDAQVAKVGKEKRYCRDTPGMRFTIFELS